MEVKSTMIEKIEFEGAKFNFPSSGCDLATSIWDWNSIGIDKPTKFKSYI